MDLLEKIDMFIDELEEKINEEKIDKIDKQGLVHWILQGKPVDLKIDSLNGVEVMLTGKGNKVRLVYNKNDDLTSTLVDISKSSGYDFDIKKSGTKHTFNITK